MQSRIQRSSLHLKHISGSQTQSLDNAISMLRSPLQRLKNKHVECSLQQLDSVLIPVFLAHRCRHSTPMEVDCLLSLRRDSNSKPATTAAAEENLQLNSNPGAFTYVD